MRLHDRGIGVGVHYPIPIHRQRALDGIAHLAGPFKATEAACDEILSLPIYPGITEEQQREVVRELVSLSG
jgi:dTDP-4-amino-4,6-dideoxygalactose transaminase